MNSLISIIRIETFVVVSGLTDEMSCRSDSCSRSGLYNFIGCVTIKGLFFLYMIQNIDFYVVFDGQTTTLQLCKTEMNRTVRLCATLYRVQRLNHDPWTSQNGRLSCLTNNFSYLTLAPELRETETNRARRMTMCNWLLCPVVGPQPLIFVRRKRTVLYV